MTLHPTDGLPGRPNRTRGALSAAVLAFGLLVAPTASMAVEQKDDPEPAVGALVDPEQPEPSRDEWRQRIEAARQRARDVARERREHPELYIPIPEDPDVAASERVLNDGSLQPGDIVTTSKGMFVYQGRPEQPPSAQDFVPVAPKPSR